MSCHVCGGTGFVFIRRDFKSNVTGKVRKNVEQVERCPRYANYFKKLLEDLGLSTLTSPKVRMQRIAEARTAPGCTAAVRRHEEVRKMKTSRDARQAGEWK